MKTKEDPPVSYGYGHVIGRTTKHHLVKFCGDGSYVSLCGVQLHKESVIDSGYGYERNVCDRCLASFEAPCQDCGGMPRTGLHPHLRSKRQ